MGDFVLDEQLGEQITDVGHRAVSYA